MARTARCPRGEAALAGLLTAIAVSCATIQEPPGGPPDIEPPIIVVVTPDSGSINDGFDGDVDFEFDEVIAEQGIDNLIRVSPRHREIDVSWKRKRITVRPKGGWYDSVAYEVTLLPGVQDLRNNRLDSGRTLLFSTGGAIPQTQLTGTVVDWEAGQIARRALVEAVRMPDSLTFITQTDSVGAYRIEALPRGRYVLFATIDQNSNGERGSRESFDSLTVQIDSVFAHNLWTFPHDTVGPRIREVQELDSVAVSVVFTQPLRPELPEPSAVRVSLLPDTVPVAVDTVLWPAVFDSIQTIVRDSIRAVQDSVAADSARAVADSARAAAGDSLPADSVVIAEPDEVVAAEPTPDAAVEEEEAAQDTTAAQRLLAERPPLIPSIVVVLGTPLRPGERYLIETTVTNVFEATETSSRPLVIPEAVADSS